MGNPEKLGDIRSLIHERDEAYGSAWKVTGSWLIELIGNLPVNKPNILRTPYLFAWIMILNKLHRALATPKDIDHWRDIAGYAQLVIEDIEDEIA